MLIEKIDLYSYFNVERPEKATKGELTVYAHTPNASESPNRLRPAMLVLGGGGYQYVSEREKEPVAMHFYTQGYNAFVLEYSCPAPYPIDLIEACMAMVYIRENAKKLQVDNEHVGAIGFSAGGHLCGCLSLLYKEAEVKAVLGEKYALAKPNAVVLSYPVITSGVNSYSSSFEILAKDNPELKAKLSLENQVTSDAPPAFIWTTVADDAVPSENTLLIATAYRKAGASFELHMFENGKHGLSLANVEVSSPHEVVAQWKELCKVWLDKRGFVINE